MALVLKTRGVNTWPCEGGCGKTLDDVSQKNKRKRYCPDCRILLAKAHNNYRPTNHKIVLPRPCEFCGIIFTPKKKSTTRFCSMLCAIRKLHDVKLYSKCVNCNKPIKMYGRKMYCNKKCKNMSYWKRQMELQNV